MSAPGAIRKNVELKLAALAHRLHRTTQELAEKGKIEIKLELVHATDTRALGVGERMTSTNLDSFRGEGEKRRARGGGCWAGGKSGDLEPSNPNLAD